MAKQCLPCTSSSSGDNANPGLCPILHDYRPFTDYQPRCASVYKMTQSNSFSSSYDQREWLIHNADPLMKKNAIDAYLSMQCKCVEPWSVGTMLPELDMQQCDDRVCKFSQNDKYGLGLGRKFSDDDSEKQFQNDYVNQKLKEQTYFKETANCCGNVNDNLYWPIDGKINTNLLRQTIPSGGQQLSVGGKSQ